MSYDSTKAVKSDIKTHTVQYTVVSIDFAQVLKITGSFTLTVCGADPDAVDVMQRSFNENPMTIMFRKGKLGV